MKGLIVIDGHDASGKTTLAEAIAKMYSGMVLHQTWTPELAPRMFNYHTERMLEAIELSREKLVVMDRLWVSEAIYADTFRGGSPWPLQGRMMDRVLMKHCAMNVLCFSDKAEYAIDLHKENLDPGHPYDDAKLRELWSRYSRLWGGCKHKYQEDNYASWLTRQGGMHLNRMHDYMYYNIDRHGKHMDGFILNMMEWLRMLQRTQYAPAMSPGDQNILGHLWKAKFLVVGERFNNKGTSYSWPFYEYANSSLFLTQALHNIGFDETKAMWTNLYDANGKVSEHIGPLSKLLKVVCLGEEVGKKVSEMITRQVYTIHHPQWASRFHHNDGTYEEELREVLQ